MTEERHDVHEAHRRPSCLVTVAILTGLLYFAGACFMMPDYGPTWDVAMGSHPYGDEVVAWWLSEEADFVEVAKRDERPAVRQPYPDFYKTQFKWYEVYPFAATLSGVSSHVLWHQLGWVPAVAAHQIVVPALVAILLAAMIVFLGLRGGLGAALSAVALLIASPRFLSHSMSNLKDVPECVLYTLVLFGAYRALTARSLTAWGLTGGLTGLALAQKANALFLPIEVLVFFSLALLLRVREVRIRWTGFAFGAVLFAVVYLAVSPAFWHDTFARIGEHFGKVREISSLDEMHALVPGQVSWMKTFSAPLNALITTPIPVLVLAALGIFRGEASRQLKLFLVVGAAFPVARLLLPGVRDFDGVRHFLEFYPSLCGLAGLGAWWLARVVSKSVAGDPSSVSSKFWRGAVVLACLIPGGVAIVDTYPYGTCYYNSLVGGLRGAQQRGVPDATDYWAHSYWNGLAWINEHAPRDAALLVPIAPHVAVAAAPVRLRDDVRLQPATIEEYPGDIYVMYVTRRPWYNFVIRHLEARATPVHEVSVQGGVILKIHQLSTPQEKSELFRLEIEEKRLWNMKVQLIDWVRANTSNRDKVRRAIETDDREGRAAAITVLREALPMVTETEAGELLRWLISHRR